MTDDAPPAPPGWYQDPDDPGVLRYWDGSGWSASPPTVPPPGVQVNTPVTAETQEPAVFRRLAEQPGVFWGAVLACIGMGIGAVGTWATALGFISIAGTAGEDGQVVLGAAAVGLLLLWARARTGAVWPAALAMLSGAVGTAISGIDLHKVSGIGTSDFMGQRVRLVHPGWGIYLAIGAGTAFVLLTLATVIVGADKPGLAQASADEQVGPNRYSAGIAFHPFATSGANRYSLAGSPILGAAPAREPRGRSRVAEHLNGR